MITLNIDPNPHLADTHANVYELVIEHEHGDADAYTEESQLFGTSPQQHQELVQIIGAYEALPEEDDLDLEKLALEYFTEQNVEPDVAHTLARKFMQLFIKGDCTTDYSSPANISGLTLYYWDSARQKHKVTILNDGKEID